MIPPSPQLPFISYILSFPCMTSAAAIVQALGISQVNHHNETLTDHPTQSLSSLVHPPYFVRLVDLKPQYGDVSLCYFPLPCVT